MASIQTDPLPVEKDLIPGAEVASAATGPANVADVTGHIAGRDVLAAGKRYRKMLEIAAHPHAFREDVHRCLGWPSSVVVKDNFFVNPVANRRSPCPSCWDGPEQFTSDTAEPIHLAVTAGQEELQHLGGEVINGC